MGILIPKQYSGTLIIIGIILIIAGILLRFTNILDYFGKLPGDIYIKKENFSLFFPITSMLILSVVVSLIFRFLSKK